MSIPACKLLSNYSYKCITYIRSRFLYQRWRKSTSICRIAGVGYQRHYSVEKLHCKSKIVAQEETKDKNQESISSFLTDQYQRRHDYLRISLTEKCNLRCLYCMPAEGVPLSPPPNLLTSPEIFLLSSIFVSQGVTKIRLTGGEPTLRPDILPLFDQLGSLREYGLRELCITTNGISLHRKLDRMVSAGLTGINISLDTLDPGKFQIITRRKGLEAVLKSIDRVLEMKNSGASIKLKVNCVVMRGINDQEIMSFVELGRDKDLDIRFIEYMPFEGNKWNLKKMIGFKEILDIIRLHYPKLMKVPDHKNDTSKTYCIPEFKGKIGFITSMTHNFCASCNRLRITSDGNLKVCLFGNAEVSLRDIIRKENHGNPIDEKTLTTIIQSNMNKNLKGSNFPHSILLHEKELLHLIGMAVSRKKEKHAGIGVLETLQNRPMILIDNPFMRTNLNRFNPKLAVSYQGAKGTASQKFTISLSQTQRLHHSSDSKATKELTHLTSSGSAQMVSIVDKPSTHRKATAICSLYFSNHMVIPLIRSNSLKKGDVLSVARIAGIMAAKKTSDLVPLCHPITITHVNVDFKPKTKDLGLKDNLEKNKYCDMDNCSNTNDFGSIEISVTVECNGQTGVEMEAMMAASVASLTIYDMCKAVDKGMRVDGLRIIRKEGGTSGTWI